MFECFAHLFVSTEHFEDTNEFPIMLEFYQCGGVYKVSMGER